MLKGFFQEKVIIIQAPAFRDVGGLKRYNKISNEHLLSKKYKVRSGNHKIIREVYKIYYVTNG